MASSCDALARAIKARPATTLLVDERKVAAHLVDRVSAATADAIGQSGQRTAKMFAEQEQRLAALDAAQTGVVGEQLCERGPGPRWRRQKRTQRAGAGPHLAGRRSRRADPGAVRDHGAGARAGVDAVRRGAAVRLGWSVVANGSVFWGWRVLTAAGTLAA